MPKRNLRSPSLTSQESYAAVIISDLVAEIPVEEENAATFKSIKEETNSGYDGHKDRTLRPRTDHSCKMDSNSMKLNGSSISKGVILNAVQFGIPDPNSEVSEKANQLKKQENPELSGFKDLSLSRKIAFVFSFVPSIMFLLCFAILLPCIPPKPCVQTMWTQFLNSSSASSSLQIMPNVVFIVEEGSDSIFIQLNSQNGYTMHNVTLPTKSTNLLCGKFTNVEQEDCVVMDERGKIHIFNGTTGTFLRSPLKAKRHSKPFLVPDCIASGDDIAVAVSETQIKLLFQGDVAYSFMEHECDSVRSTLIPWTIQNVTDIIFLCKNDSFDSVKKIPQDYWCSFGPSELSWSLDLKLDSRGFLIQPFEEYLLLWSGDEVTAFSSDGLQKWNINSQPHSDKNRFIFYGNYIGQAKQIALLSSDISSKLQITLLNISNGNITHSTAVNSVEANEVVQVQGEKGDFFVVATKAFIKDVVKQTLLATDTLTKTVVPYLTEKELSNYLFSKNVQSQELTFMTFDGVFHSIQKLQDVYSKVSMKVTRDNDILYIYLLRSVQESATPNKTEVRQVKVEEWDISMSKVSECVRV